MRVDGLSYEEAAAAQGERIGTIASRVAVADAKLAEQLLPPAPTSTCVVEVKVREVDELAADFAPVAHDVIDIEIPDDSGHVDYDESEGRAALHRNDWERDDYHQQFEA